MSAVRIEPFDGATGRAGQKELDALLERAVSADGRPPLSEQKRLDLAHPEDTRHAGFLSLDGHGRIIGYVHLRRTAGGWGLEVVVDPDHRGPAAGVGELLVDRALDHVASMGGGRVYYWVVTEEDARRAAARGMRPERELLRMSRSLPLHLGPDGALSGGTVSAAGTVPDGTVPDGTVLRAFRPGVDEAAWIATNNEAFAAHPEQAGWDVTLLEERETEPWFDPEGFLVLEEDRTIAGSCWTKLDRDARPVSGEIYVISVHPRWHGRGIGRFLTVAGLDWLARHGARIGLLYVEASNDSARRLYESLGFSIEHRERAYVREIAPAGTP